MRSREKIEEEIPYAIKQKIPILNSDLVMHGLILETLLDVRELLQQKSKTTQIVNGPYVGPQIVLSEREHELLNSLEEKE